MTGENTVETIYPLIDKMAAEAARELAAYGKTGAAGRVFRLAKRMLGRYAPEPDPMFWPAGMLLLGMSEYLRMAQRAGSKADPAVRQTVQEAVESHVDRWAARGSRLVWIDDVLAGAGLAGIAELTGEERYYDACDRMFAFAAGSRKDPAGGVVYRPGRAHEEVLADGVGQMALFLSRYAAIRPEKAEEALAMAGQQLTVFRRCCFDRASGLPVHGYEMIGAEAEAFHQNARNAGAGGAVEDAGLQEGGALRGEARQAAEEQQADQTGIWRKGLTGWGRAVGWYMMGLAGYLDAVCDGGRIVTDGHTDCLLAIVESYRRPDGMFPWCFPVTQNYVGSEGGGEDKVPDASGQSVAGQARHVALDSNNVVAAERSGFEQGRNREPAGGLPVDCSATAMISYAESFLFPASCRQARLGGAQAALLRYTDPEGKVTQTLAECRGFGDHPQIYGSYPWGQGSVLAFLARMAAPDSEKGQT